MQSEIVNLRQNICEFLMSL